MIFFSAGGVRSTKSSSYRPHNTTQNAKQFSEADEKPTPGQHTTPKTKRKKKLRKKIKEGEVDTAALARPLCFAPARRPNI